MQLKSHRKAQKQSNESATKSTSTPAGKLKAPRHRVSEQRFHWNSPTVIQSLITIIRLDVSDSGAVTHSLSFPPIHETLLISIEIVIHLQGNRKTTTTLHSSSAPTAYQLSHDIILRIYQL
jgi:hypothetical protein